VSQEPAHDLFVSYAPADRSWVEGYLFDALDAAGVDYVSEAAFELGAPRVAEFERAVRESRRTLLVITPAYLADAYAPFADLLAQTFGIEAGTWPVIPLTLEDAALPPRLAMLVALDATEPDQWGSAVDKLCAAIGRPGPATTPPPCPYPGMLPFREADAARFFGRDAVVGEMVDRLRHHRFLAVIGPSGTGKSSLVLAGLLPALRRSGLFGPGEWNVVVFRPGADPLDALALARTGAPDGARSLLVCDQFEETFTIGRDQATAFQQRLGELAGAEQCWVVITARADFYADLMASPLWDEVSAHRVEIAPLGAAGLREAIVRPAETAGVHVDPALVERLVADACGEPGVLPLVQEALVLSWEHLARRYLPLEAYESIAAGDPGRTGLEVAMARRADAALAELAPEQQVLARRVFVRLVQFGEGRADTRRQQRLTDLRAAGDAPSELDTTLGHLVDRRLLTSTGAEDGSDRRIDLAHEALIAGWPTLRGWLTERREAEQTRRRLDAKAAEWVRLGRGEGGLLDEVELAETERWLAGPDAAELGYDPALADLAAESRRALDRARAARRRRVRAVIASLAAGLIVVAGLAVWGALSARSARREERRALAATDLAEEQRAVAEEQQAVAEEQRALAEAQAVSASSRQLAADAVTQLDRDVSRGMLLAVRAYRTEPTAPARDSLLTALEASPRLARIMDAGGGEIDFATQVAFTRDDEQLVAVIDGELRRWDAATGEPLGEAVTLIDDPFSPTVEFSADGTLLAIDNCLGLDTDAPCTIHIWDVESGTEVGDPIEARSPYVSAIAFSADRRLLAVADASEDPAIHLWNLARRRWVGNPMRTPAQSVAFSPDGRTLASGRSPESFATGESSVSLWEVASQELIAETPVYTAGGVSALAFTSDGGVIAAAHGNGEVRVLNATDLTSTDFEYRGPDGVFDVQFSPDGALIATASHTDEHLQLWLPTSVTPEDLAGHQGQAYDLAFSADGRRLVSAGADGRLILWRAGDGHALRVGGGPVHAGAISAIGFDGDAVVTLGRAASADGISLGAPEVGRWDTSTDELRSPVTVPDGVLALSPDGRVAAVADDRGTITQVDTGTGAPAGPTITAHGGPVTGLEFGSDGRTLVSSGCREPSENLFCDERAELALWDATTGRPVARTQIEAPFSRLALSPDGSTVAASNGGSEIWLWDVAMDAVRPEPLVADDRTVDLVWSPDGETLAVTGDAGGAHGPSAGDQRNRNVILWDASTGTRIGEPLLGHESGVTAAAFSPDGTVLASGDFAGDIRLWDVETLRPRGDRIATGSSVDDLRFGPDGTTLASGHGDGRLGLWDMTPEGWIEQLCAAAGRDLTTDEWTEFVGVGEHEETCPGAGGR
jgi:WD40 repeat protein